MCTQFSLPTHLLLQIRHCTEINIWDTNWCWNVAVGDIYIPHRVLMKQVLWRHWRTKVNVRKCHWSWSYDDIGEQRWTPESVTEADLTTYQENKSECQRRTKVELLAFTVHVSVSLSLCRPCSLWSVCLKCSWLCSDCRGKGLAPSGVCVLCAADCVVTVGANSSLRSVCLMCSWLCRSKKTWARQGHYCITVSRHCTYFFSILSDMLTSRQ